MSDSMSTLLDRLNSYVGDLDDDHNTIAVAAQIVLPCDGDAAFAARLHDGTVWRIYHEDHGEGYRWYADEVGVADDVDHLAYMPQYPALVAGLPTRD